MARSTAARARRASPASDRQLSVGGYRLGPAGPLVGGVGSAKGELGPAQGLAGQAADAPQPDEGEARAAAGLEELGPGPLRLARLDQDHGQGEPGRRRQQPGVQGAGQLHALTGQP